MRACNPFRLAPHALIFTLFILASAAPASSQQRWERTYGGTADEEGYSVQQTSDGGYIVAGGTNSFGNGYQVYLVKTNASGDTLWTRTYGGAGDDRGRSVQQTSDTGYIVAGWTGSFGNGMQVYIIKTNASGDLLWSRTYGGSSDDRGRSVQQTSDGGYIVAGWTSSNGIIGQVYLVKTNASGDTLWSGTYGGSSDEEGYSVQQTSDTGYIVAGTTGSFGNGWQVYLIKTNASGDTLWTRHYGGAVDDRGRSVRQTSDSGYIVAGMTTSFGAYEQVYIIKTNASGDTLWTRNYGGAGWDWGYSVQQTSDGGYIVAGESASFGDYYQVYLIRTNASGVTLWTKTYGGTNVDRGYSVQQTTDMGYIIAGGTYSFGAGGSDVYLIKTDANGSSGVDEKAVSSPISRPAFSVRPNPFASFAKVPGHKAERFSLYDVSGRKVGTYRGDRVGEGLGQGVYFLRSSDSKEKPLRIVKVK